MGETGTFSFTARVYAHVMPQQGADAAAKFAALVHGGDEQRQGGADDEAADLL